MILDDFYSFLCVLILFNLVYMFLFMKNTINNKNCIKNIGFLILFDLSLFYFKVSPGLLIIPFTAFIWNCIIGDGAQSRFGKFSFYLCLGIFLFLNLVKLANINTDTLLMFLAFIETVDNLRDYMEKWSPTNPKSKWLKSEVVSFRNWLIT